MDMMNNVLEKVNHIIDALFSNMEKGSSFCYDKLSVFLKHAYAWSVVIGIVLILIMGIYLSTV